MDFHFELRNNEKMLKPEQMIATYIEKENDKEYLADYLLKYCLNYQYHWFREVVEKLNIYGDFILENKQKKIKASVFWFAVFSFDERYSSFINNLISRGNCNINSLGTLTDRQLYDVPPLYVACALNYPKCIDILINAGVDANFPNKFGITPLMLAARHRLEDHDELIADKLISTHLVNLNAQNNKGNTALHYAIDMRNYKYAGYLIRAGIDPFLKNNNGHDALTLFALTLGHDYDPNYDDDKDSIQNRKYVLKLFSDELMRKYENINLSKIYYLLGASLEPFDLIWQKRLWKLALKSQQRSKIEDKQFIKVTDKREFKTDKDIDTIHSEIDSVIQCIFILQRIVEPNDSVIKRRFKLLLRLYIINNKESKSKKLLEYVLDYNRKHNADNEYKIIKRNLKFIKHFIEDFDFDYIYEIITDIFETFTNLNNDENNVDLYNDIILVLSGILYYLFVYCRNSGNVNHLNKLRCFVDEKIAPAKLKILPNKILSIYDIFRQVRNDKEFINFVDSSTPV